MHDLEELLETYKQKLMYEQHDKQLAESVEITAGEIFNKNFSEVFSNIIETINKKLNVNVINYKSESKNRFSIEGNFHRIIFQKGKVEKLDNIINVNIIPLCIWKGVTKHLGPISFVKNLETDKLKWNLPEDSVEIYVKTLLGKLADDEDFYM